MNNQTVANTVDPHDPANLREALAAVMEDRGLSQNQTAGKIGLSHSVISQWLKGTYRGDNDAVAEKIAAFIAHARGSALVFRPSDIPFQRTETSERIWTILRQSHVIPSISVIAGVPGVGKTATAEAYERAFPNVWLCTMDPTIRTPGAVLNEVASTMSIAHGSPTTLRNRIGDRLKGSDGLIIIDESQNLKLPGLEILRTIYDRYKVGVALIGNYGLFAGTSAPTKTNDFAQFYRRIQSRIKLDRPADDDIEKLLDAWQIDDKEMRAYLGRIFTKQWGISGPLNTLQMGSSIAFGQGKPLAIAHLRAAFQQLYGGG